MAEEFRDAEGGDPACWLQNVCPACGLLVEGRLPERCPRCGTPLEETGPPDVIS